MFYFHMYGQAGQHMTTSMCDGHSFTVLRDITRTEMSHEKGLIRLRGYNDYHVDKDRKSPYISTILNGRRTIGMDNERG